ncbi:uncharacterized protein [Choristoneura fumiferana]|uniref:uncharacterized protein n=1 Tax=Choristoneura fumiferana TaxID=7141 RepID=UPI003D154ADB
MAIICAGCRKPITTSQQMLCSICEVHYHPECVNVNYGGMSRSAVLGWSCPSCRSKVPKTDNSNTPARPQAALASSTESLRANVTLRPQNRESEKRSQSPASTTDGGALTALTMEIKLLREDMGELKNHIKHLTSCMENCVARLDDCDKRLACSDAKIRALEERDLEGSLLRQGVVQLEERFNAQAQYGMQNEIEVQGINEHTNENLFHIIKVAATKIGMELDETDVDDVSRVGPNRGSGSQLSEPSAPRPVVLRFVRHMKRQEFLKAAKYRRNITTEDIEVSGRRNKIFFNEMLTKENRWLFRRARQEKSTQGFKYCWTSNGHIFIRKRKGGPAIAIQGASDLDRIREMVHDSPPPEPGS